MYMRHVEPWLDATGWGTTWPSLKDRYPDLERRPPQQGGNDAGTTAPAQGRHQGDRGNGDGGDADGGEDTDISELEDGDGEDPEQPEENDSDDSDEDMDRANANKRTHPRDEEGNDNRGDETDEEEGHHL
jgi:hypothetical protein